MYHFPNTGKVPTLRKCILCRKLLRTLNGMLELCNHTLHSETNLKKINLHYRYAS